MDVLLEPAGEDSMMWEWRWLTGLHLQNLSVLPALCSWGGRKSGAGKAVGLHPSQLWHRAAQAGAREAILVGNRRELGPSCIHSHIPALPCSIKAGQTWELAAPVCFPATAGRELPHGHRLRLEEGSDPEHVPITNPPAPKGLPLV